MAIWYVSSADYAALSTMPLSTAVTVGQLYRATTPSTANHLHVFRVTTAGTTAGSEPSWVTTVDGSTTTSGTATFTRVTGRAAHGWAAAAGTANCINGFTGNGVLGTGDILAYAHTHAEAIALQSQIGSYQGTVNNILCVSVNRAGAVPPTDADYLPGAVVEASGASELRLDGNPRVRGITMKHSGTSAIRMGSVAGMKDIRLEDCLLWLSGAGSSQSIFFGGASQKTSWKNTPVKFSHASQTITVASSGVGNLEWIGTASAVQGTSPNALFSMPSNITAFLVVGRGLDLSGMGSGVALVSLANTGSLFQATFHRCKINSAVTRLTTSNPNNNVNLDLTQCYDGSYTFNERWNNQGNVTHETTIVRTGGAADNVGGFSFKMISSAVIAKDTYGLWSPWFGKYYGVTGVSKTVTVEVITSAVLDESELTLEFEYAGTSGSSLASYVDTTPDPLKSSMAALTGSSATWASSPSTPHAYKLTGTFTPQLAGPFRARVGLKKASQTVYVDPMETIA